MGHLWLPPFTPPNHLSVVHNSQIKGTALQSPEGFLPFVLLVVGVDSDQ